MASRSQQSFFGLAAFFLLLIIVMVVVLWERKRGAESFPTQVQSPSGSLSAIPPVPSAETPSSTPESTTNETAITYSKDGFSPKIIHVKKGTVVTFLNKSSENMWPASNPHPSHVGYPTSGGCIGSTFDACGEIPPNGSWQFEFDIIGTWGYHNHLNPKNTATVIVE